MLDAFSSKASTSPGVSVLITLLREDGAVTNMGETAAFLSPRRAYQRLYDAGYILPPAVVKRWPEIAAALRLLVKVEPTITKLEEVEQWIISYLRRRTKPTLVDPEDQSHSLSLVISHGTEYGGAFGVAADKEGRLHIHLGSVIPHARMQLGQNLSQKSLAGYFRMMGFENIKDLSIHREGSRRQVSIWVSPAGFLPDEFIVGREVEETPFLNG